MNVLHVTASMSSDWGGPVAVVSQLTHTLSAEGVNCEIATTRGRRVGTDISPIEGTPINSFDTELPSRIWTAYSSALDRFLNESVSRFDIVHVHEIWHYAGYAAYCTAKKNEIPFVLTPHGELGEWHLRHKAVKKRLYMALILGRMLRNADALHAITPSREKPDSGIGIRYARHSRPEWDRPRSIRLITRSVRFSGQIPIAKGKARHPVPGPPQPHKGTGHTRAQLFRHNPPVPGRRPSSRRP